MSHRVAIIEGVRTPFVRAGTAFKNLSMVELGKISVKGLIDKTKIHPAEIDELVYGAVLLDPKTPNWARQIVLTSGLPAAIGAHSVSNNCISSLVAISVVTESIRSGRIKAGLAGGSESMSNPPVMYKKKSAMKFLALSRARTLGQRLTSVLRFNFNDFLPDLGGFAEPSTGLTMGQHMEITAKEWKIGRKEQDEIAFASHQNAHRAAWDGRLKEEIVPVAGIDRDTFIRMDTSMEKLGKLPPVFDRSGQGTLTAGNSSPLTDGAATVLLMSEEQAKASGRKPLAFIRDYEYAALDPKEGLLMAPALAVPRLLRRTGLALKDFDIIEMHEAFGAQVLANIAAWEKGWREPAIGRVSKEQLNPLGSSIALGHPFAATGARIATTLAKELDRRRARRGLISICAAGAMAGAMILERDES